MTAARAGVTSRHVAALSTLFLSVLLLTLAPPSWADCGDGTSDAAASCCGDCDGDGRVTVDEIVRLVGIALGEQPIDACVTACPCSQLGRVCVQVAVDDIVSVINNALSGCVGGVSSGQGEACDDGGVCIGGPSAGRPCISEGDCEGRGGVCVGGLRDGRACEIGELCDGGRCIKCKPFGGDGCAANCTIEREIAYRLVPGVFGNGCEGGSCADGYAFVATYDPVLSGEVTLVVGEDRDGRIPAIMRQFGLPAGFNSYVGNCLTGIPLMTCGGTLFETDGTQSPSCTEGFPDRVECSTDRPCASVFGGDNVAVGEVGCAGLAGADFESTTECGVPPDLLRGPQQIVRNGSGPPGSAFFYSSVSLDTGTYPNDPRDPAEICSVPLNRLRFLLPLTTASAGSVAFHGFKGTIEASEMGRPFSCSDLNGGTVTGTWLVGANSMCEADLAGIHFLDVALPFKLVAQ